MLNVESYVSWCGDATWDFGNGDPSRKGQFYFFLRRKGTTVKVRFYYFGGLISLAYGLGQSILWGLGMHRNKDNGILS